MNNKKDTLSAGGVILLGLLLLLWGTNEYIALFQLLGLAVSSFGIYKLIRVRNRTDVRDNPEYRKQDESLGQEIRRLQGIIKVLQIIAKAIIAVFFCMILIPGVNTSLLPFLVVGLIYALFQTILEHYRKELKTFVAENITRQALEEVFDVEEYRPFGCISSQYVRGSSFGISSFDDLYGNDYMKGFYHGLPIEMCDLTLTSHETRTDEDGNTEEYDAEVFSGFWLICDFGKKLSADIRLWERGSIGKLMGGKGIQTENEKFNKQFHVESESEQEAFYILTPHMMEYILQMDQKARGETHIRFDRRGKMQIAIRKNRDAFEIGKKVRDATLLRKQFVQEIRYVTDLIDELRLVDTLYQMD